MALYIESKREFFSAIRTLSSAGIEIVRYDTPQFDFLPQLGTYSICIDGEVSADELIWLRKFVTVHGLGFSLGDFSSYGEFFFG